MEQDVQTTSDYKKLTTDLIRENLFAFAIGGLIFFGAIASIGFGYGNGIQSSIENQTTKIAQVFSTSSASNDNVNKIAQSVRDQSIDYISPVPQTKESPTENLGIVAQESGQISAISSSQVTYKKNRYTIQPGESLQDVSKKVYGDSNAWIRIAQANNIENPDHIEVGMELIIPR